MAKKRKSQGTPKNVVRRSAEMKKPSPLPGTKTGDHPHSAPPSAKKMVNGRKQSPHVKMPMSKRQSPQKVKAEEKDDESSSEEEELNPKQTKQASVKKNVASNKPSQKPAQKALKSLPLPMNDSSEDDDQDEDDAESDSDIALDDNDAEVPVTAASKSKKPTPAPSKPTISKKPAKKQAETSKPTPSKSPASTSQQKQQTKKADESEEEDDESSEEDDVEFDADESDDANESDDEDGGDEEDDSEVSDDDDDDEPIDPKLKAAAERMLKKGKLSSGLKPKADDSDEDDDVVMPSDDEELDDEADEEDEDMDDEEEDLEEDEEDDEESEEDDNEEVKRVKRTIAEIRKKTDEGEKKSAGLKANATDSKAVSKTKKEMVDDEADEGSEEPSDEESDDEDIDDEEDSSADEALDEDEDEEEDENDDEDEADEEDEEELPSKASALKRKAPEKEVDLPTKKAKGNQGQTITTSKPTEELKLFVGRLPLDATQKSVTAFFKTHGVTVRSVICKKKFAFVEVASKSDEKTAMGLSGEKFGSSPGIVVSAALQKDVQLPKSKEQLLTSPDNAAKGQMAGSSPGATPRDESKDLFIKNLAREPKQAVNDALKKLFPNSRSIRVVSDRSKNQRCKGFAFITMPTEEAVAEAINSKQGTKLLGRALFLDFCGGKSKQEPVKRADAPTTSNSNVLLVGNLPYNMDNDELKNVLECQSIRPMTKNREVVKGKVFAQFANASEAGAARQKFNQTDFGGRRMNIVFARPLEPQITTDKTSGKGKQAQQKNQPAKSQKQQQQQKKKQESSEDDDDDAAESSDDLEEAAGSGDDEDEEVSGDDEEESDDDSD